MSYSFQHLHIPYVTLLVVLPICAILLPCVPKLETIVLGSLFQVQSFIGITAGYHRLWTHKCYKASKPLRYLLAIIACGHMQKDVIWWSRHHRAHHRYLDTDKDPYSITEGFFHAHIGWIFFHTPEKWGPVDVSDVERDPVAKWQQTYYYLLFIMVGIITPSAICHLGWQDFCGGLVYAGFWRIWLGYQATALANSWAHYSGRQPYSTKITAREVPIVALLIGGEGYHNFHHRFPSDYRNGVRWYDLDICKWFIWVCSRLGLAKDLVRTPGLAIEQAKKQAQGILCEDTIQDSDLPTITWKEYEDFCRTGRCLLSISDRVCDVTEFLNIHPGGPETLQQAIGTDASNLFNQIDHSPYARKVLSSIQIAVIETTPRAGGVESFIKED